MAKKKAAAKSRLREGAVLVLMDPDQRQEIDDAAASEGIATGTWLRMLGLREARKKKER